MPSVHDVTMTVRPGMPVYPGDPEVEWHPVSSTEQGDPANLARIALGTHTGTHLDAPYHVDHRWPTIQEIAIDRLIGPARVYAVDHPTAIARGLLAALDWDGVDRVLFKTRNSAFLGQPFRPDSVHLTVDAARFLVERTRVRLVGIDSLSIEATGAPDLPVHRTLLGHGVLVLEGLDLSRVEPGWYYLLCLPMKLCSPDGAPCRALLAGPYPSGPPVADPWRE